jgi:outer membrane protein assembly factor BamB
LALRETSIAALSSCVQRRLVWETNMMEGQPEVRITAAPLPIKGTIIVGASGGDSGVRDWIAGLDATTGKPIWRKYTIPAPGEPGSETWKGTNNSWQTGAISQPPRPSASGDHLNDLTKPLKTHRNMK